MKDLKRAFGSPHPEFTDRIRQTLFQIEEKEEINVKKKLTFSMAMALILCICIVTVSAFAGTALITAKPDVTRSPLSRSANENPSQQNTARPTESPGPSPTITPTPALTPVPDYLYDMTASLIAQRTYVYLQNADAWIYHLNCFCRGTEHPYQLTLLSAVHMGRTACTECIGDNGYFYTSQDDPYFHPSPDCCSGSERSLRITLMEAYALEKILCTDQSVIRPTSLPGQTDVLIPFSTPAPYADAKLTVPPAQYSTESNVLTVCLSDSDETIFHLTPYCQALVMKQADGKIITPTVLTLPDALNANCSPCVLCCGSETICTINGDLPYHHPDRNCASFRLSSSVPLDVTLTEALLRGKLPCRECILNEETASSSIN